MQLMICTVLGALRAFAIGFSIIGMINGFDQCLNPIKTYFLRKYFTENKELFKGEIF